MFSKYELEMLERWAGRSIAGMVASKFVGEQDPYLLKCQALRTKLKNLAHPPKGEADG